jgi:hypothetical protein
MTQRNADAVAPSNKFGLRLEPAQRGGNFDGRNLFGFKDEAGFNWTDTVELQLSLEPECIKPDFGSDILAALDLIGDPRTSDETAACVRVRSRTCASACFASTSS